MEVDKLKHYNVYATAYVTLVCEVEACDEEEAKMISLKEKNWVEIETDRFEIYAIDEM